MRPPFLTALSFSEGEIAEAESKRGILEFRLHLNNECNIRCTYCLDNTRHISDPCEDGAGSHLTLDERKDVIKQAKELGAKTVVFTGNGEPLLSNQLLDLISFNDTLGLKSVVFSNMLALTENLAQQFNKSHVSVIGKLNTFNPSLQARLAGGFPGIYDVFMQRLNMLIGLGYANDYRLAINSIICKDNFTEIPALFMYCRENLIIPWIETVNIVGRATKDLAVEPERITALFNKIAALDEASYGYHWKPTPPILAADYTRYKYVCQVDTAGNVYPTDGLKGECGSIKSKSLEEIINSKTFVELRKRDRHGCNIS